MSLFKTRRDHRSERLPAAFDTDDLDPTTASVEGVTLDGFVTFIATVARRAVSETDYETIAQQLGFPAGRYDLIRTLWMSRVYASPALAREFGERLDEARKNVV